MTQTTGSTNDRKAARREKGLDAGIHSVAGVQPPLVSGCGSREVEVELWRRFKASTKEGWVAWEAVREWRRENGFQEVEDEAVMRPYVRCMRRCWKLREVLRMLREGVAPVFCTGNALRLEVDEMGVVRHARFLWNGGVR